MWIYLNCTIYLMISPKSRNPFKSLVFWKKFIKFIIPVWTTRSQELENLEKRHRGIDAAQVWPMPPRLRLRPQTKLLNFYRCDTKKKTTFCHAFFTREWKMVLALRLSHSMRHPIAGNWIVGHSDSSADW